MSTPVQAPYVAPPPGAAPDPNVAFLQQQMAQQANTTGLTQMAPAVPNVQVRQPEPFQPRAQQSTGPVGPGQGPWAKQVQTQNFVAQVQNMAGKVAQVVEQRKARQQQQVFDQFATANKGLNDAQGQMQSAQQQVQQATAALQADPNNAQAKQALLQASQQLKQAQSAIQQNQTIINDIANDPKKAKLLSKGFGIDDKNAGTPERQAAINAIKKNTGVGDSAAKILSGVPQTQQLSPQSGAQQLARQAGVVGAPATQGQLLKASTDAAKMAQTLEINRDNRERMFVRDLPKMEAQGLTFAKDKDGNVQFDDRGFPKPVVMTKEEVASNPVQASKNEALQAAIDLKKAQEDAVSDPNSPSNKARMMTAQARMIQAQTQAKLVADGNIGGMAAMVSQGKMAPSQVPAKLRAAVLGQAQVLNPNLNPEQLDSNFATAKATDRDFAVGKAGTNIRSLNTGIGHLDQLVQASDALKNNDLTKLNQLAGVLKRAGLSAEQGTDALAVFNTIESAVTGEVASTYKGTGATDQEIKGIEKSFSDAKASRTTDKAAMETINLFYSRLNSLDYQHKVGRSEVPFNTLNPESTSILKKYGFDTENREPKEVSGILGGGGQDSASDDELLKMLDNK